MNEMIQGTGGIRLFYRQQAPANPVAWILIVHGWGEHCGRYNYVAEKLNESGFAVAMYDQRGHGKSEGLTTYVNKFRDYVDDLHIVFKKISQAVNLPVFLLAHSMGGLVACYFCVQHQPSLRGVMLSAPSLKVNKDFSPFLQKISGVVSALAPKLATVRLDNRLLSRDPAVLATVERDPLHYKGGIRARTGAEVLKATKWITTHAREFIAPVLLLHGGADEIADPQGSLEFYENCGSSDKRRIVYPGAYHEILNEINKDEVIHDLQSWILNRCDV